MCFVLMPEHYLMKRSIFLLLALTILVGTAQAEWTAIETFEDDTQVFADSKSVRRTGDQAQLLHLVRWGEAQIDDGYPSYRSTVVRTAYDCNGKREKYLASTSYAGPMGDGETVVADDNEAGVWYSISDESMEEKLWAIACGSVLP